MYIQSRHTIHYTILYVYTIACVWYALIQSRGSRVHLGDASKFVLVTMPTLLEEFRVSVQASVGVCCQNVIFL